MVIQHTTYQIEKSCQVASAGIYGRATQSFKSEDFSLLTYYKIHDVIPTSGIVPRWGLSETQYHLTHTAICTPTTDFIIWLIHLHTNMDSHECIEYREFSVTSVVIK